MAKVENCRAINSGEGNVVGVVPSAVAPTYAPRPPRVAYKLDTPRAWLKELGNVYRAARKGIIPIEHLSRFAYACNIAGSKAYQCEYGEYLKSIDERLKRIEGEGTVSYVGVEDPVALDMAQSMEHLP
jgi:hypothetical protein